MKAFNSVGHGSYGSWSLNIWGWKFVQPNLKITAFFAHHLRIVFRAPACVEGMTRMPFAAVVAWQVLQGRHHLCQPCAGAWRSCVSLPRMRIWDLGSPSCVLGIQRWECKQVYFCNFFWFAFVWNIRLSDIKWQNASLSVQRNVKVYCIGSPSNGKLEHADAGFHWCFSEEALGRGRAACDS